jgi:hypothetical protein
MLSKVSVAYLTTNMISLLSMTVRLRKMVRTTLSEIEPDERNWAPFLSEVFQYYVSDYRYKFLLS